ncbi:hypothetical protein DPMN_065861 [Dreissena polymorpha]|uniref:Uncharacterized protein n=1 Tax=Dreissena polymorpha TaxID=45954 RepID=A0A9D4BRL3_DREPO|nr:hypothetical protein DPMN_065861 [Dreissena polymorpha]
MSGHYSSDASRTTTKKMYSTLKKSIGEHNRVCMLTSNGATQAIEFLLLEKKSSECWSLKGNGR